MTESHGIGVLESWVLKSEGETDEMNEEKVEENSEDERIPGESKCTEGRKKRNSLKDSFEEWEKLELERVFDEFRGELRELRDLVMIMVGRVDIC